jgi:hypothetical protein
VALTLPSSQHNEEVNLVAILDGPKEFIGICGGMIQIDFDSVKKFIFFRKECLLHSGVLFDQLVQTFTDGIPLYGYHFRAVGELSVCGMDVYLSGHVLLLCFHKIAGKPSQSVS